MAAPDLIAQLRGADVGDVLVDTATRAAYSTDASLYRVVPQVVVRPRTTDQLIGVAELARTWKVPLTMRGAGTSIAGNAVGEGIVVDTSRHLNQVLEVDPQARLARVQPGIVHASLQQAVGVHDLRFGPDPSSHTRCTIGGMIGNDACGSRALGYGRTSANIVAMSLVSGTGELMETSQLTQPGISGGKGIQAQLQRVVANALEPLRTELGRFTRQVSGYQLQYLLPENGFDLTRMLVGSEGTLGVVTEATVRLVDEPAHRILVVLGFADYPEAGDAVMQVLPHEPVACEGLDSRIVDVLTQRWGASAVPPLPRGAAWLFVELVDDDWYRLVDRANRLAKSVDCFDSRVVPNLAEARQLWRIREDGAGLSGQAPSGKPAWAGWEDSAVPPAALGAYLRDFEELLAEYNLTTMPYGHFGEGCLHTRIDMDLSTPAAAATMRRFIEAATDLVVAHGGSLSGEHGDGRARSELLPRMYSAQVMELFAAVKAIFDPDNLLNPGVLVAPEPFDANLRRPLALQPRQQLGFAYADDGGSFLDAIHRCTGVGKCRSVVQGAGTVMCPSYAATGEELHSTRGRARVLQEMVNGNLVGRSWADPAVEEALDLCLSCKGCVSDCPTSVDMATYKAEVNYQKYRRRLRPRSHYFLGWLPRWAKLASLLPSLANLLLNIPGLRRLGLWIAGVDSRRSLPTFAADTARSTLQRRGLASEGRPVVVFLDSFTQAFAPQLAVDVVTVLENAGYAPQLTSPKVCCGLTWISTGQLDAARKKVARTVAQLYPVVEQGIPIVGIEPSCIAALRDDAPKLIDDEPTRAVAAAIQTLTELLTSDPDYHPPDLAGVEVVAQPHCHHHAIMGWDADRALLDRAGATVHQLGGCCGLAGNFGMELGHYDVSVQVAQLQLLPALQAHPEAVYLADGFSCRLQADDLAARPGVHLASMLARHGVRQ